MVPNTNITQWLTQEQVTELHCTTTKQVGNDERSVKRDCPHRRASGPPACRWATPLHGWATYTLPVAMPTLFCVSVS